MRLLPIVLVAAWFAPVSTPVFAQQGAVTDESFLRAALVVYAYDRLAADCREAGGFEDDAVAAIAGWEAANGVAGVRARLPEYDAHPGYRDRLDAGVSSIVGAITAQGVGPCLAVVTLIKLPDARFAPFAPDAPAPAMTPPAPPAPPAPATPPAPPAPATADLLARIDQFGFDTRPKMGIGGFITLDIYPVVLLRSGEALTDVTGLSFAGGLDAHRRAYPEAWTRWRKTGGELQLEKRDGWQKLPFQTTYGALPADLKLDGLFRYLGGTGTQAVGGTSTVAAYTEYRFTSDGRVQRGGGAGSTASAGGTSVVSSQTAPARAGRYSIDGLVLRIRYDDGSSEQHILITDPAEPDGAIWLDGLGYVQRDR
ncbi:MAG: hypothetical protein R2834_19695 [Rhodothermales bacterium]